MSAPPEPAAGSDADFRQVREFLDASGYTEAFLLERFAIPHLHFLLYPIGQQGRDFEERYHGDGLPLLLSRLLMGGFSASSAELDAQIPAGVQRAMRALGLLEAEPDAESQFYTPVLLYPVFGLYVTADRSINFNGVPGYGGLDYVMSGTEHICRDYVESLPDARCERFLEIGTGSGLGALLSSRCAGHVWASDITPRAARYAEFNRRLNGVTNMTVLEGDLFAPVEGMQFDRIACNPPFEPPLKRALVFSVGGEDGEQIMKRLVAEAPAHLRPGGRLYAQVMGTDRETGPFDMRIREWLGDWAGECDSTLFVRQTMQPREYSIQQILGQNDDAWKLDDWNRFYRKLRAVSVVHGHLVVQRRREERPVFHAARRFGPRTGMREMEWLLECETSGAGPGFAETALAMRPVAADGWELLVSHTLRDGRLAPRGYTLKTAYPFEVSTGIPPWVAAMLARCDGTHTGAELLQWVRANGALEGEAGAEEFLKSLGALISCGFLR